MLRFDTPIWWMMFWSDKPQVCHLKYPWQVCEGYSPLPWMGWGVRRGVWYADFWATHAGGTGWYRIADCFLQSASHYGLQSILDGFDEC